MTAAHAPGSELPRLCRPLADWPQADQDAWSAAIAPGDWLEAGGKGEAWAPVTRAGIIKSYGRWLTWLEHTGSLDPAQPPGERATPKAVSAFMVALETVNAPKTVLHRITGLAQAIRAMAPETDWAWLWGIVTRPLRISNLASIEIGRHLIQTAGGFDLRFPAEEMKNRRLEEGALPAALVAPMTRYLLHYRPLLVARSRTPDGPGATLWLSKSGSPMLPNKLYERIVKQTQKRFGQSINPHMFRDVAATAIATRDPKHVRITPSVLGHTRLSTSEQYYNHARSLEAGRLYQKWILSLRRQPVR